ncbi:MAG: NAD(P)/FAD-dependent oxidoreductase [Candidatus Cloacimonetes bacterium]|nr:NAD(P)/FAD-dependent oxidoreductase [Candidatus Cloacimonadota bacterium]
MNNKTAIIIGAGPAGLTATYELLEKTNIIPIIYEMSSDIGGISKTVKYKGNRIDLGGHRFFSKSKRVMDFWQNVLPVQGKRSKDDIALGRKTLLSNEANAPDPEKDDNVMLVRGRLSRIFFLRNFFDYPISLNIDTFKNLGFIRIVRIGLSYIWSRIFKIKEEKTLEDFFINRFGKELYNTFFKDYTHKVWGRPCSEIKPEWGAQRIKGLSISKAVFHAIKSIFKKDDSIHQMKTETSLIEQFMYPKFGPGQLWEELARKIKAKGGRIHLNCEVTGFASSQNEITSVTVRDSKRGKSKEEKADYFFSTMPVKDLINSMNDVPTKVIEIANGLIYRDFITVGLLLKKLRIKNQTKQKTINNIVPDNWIYIQERDVKVGRLQIFNNWSPYMVEDDDTVWIGLEYFCNEGDELWGMPDEEFTEFAISELEKIEIINKNDVLDSTVIRMPKTYPAYFGSYDKFNDIRDHVDKIENLFLIGRNGMHRYNNQDHSMLTAIEAVENVIHNVKTKDNIWNVNTEEEYHEA